MKRIGANSTNLVWNLITVVEKKERRFFGMKYFFRPRSFSSLSAGNLKINSNRWSKRREALVNVDLTPQLF